MLKPTLALAGIAFLAACQSAPSPPAAPIELHPFVGCWESEDGLSREGWTADPSGWLVGYSATRTEDNKVTFFEFMRIERGVDIEEALVIAGPNEGEVRFTREPIAEDGFYRFVNPDHDFPQVIEYRRSGDRLDAQISHLDGSDPVAFPKVACKF